MTEVAASFFDERKASEVAFYFLSKAKASGRSVTKLRFIKWLYLAERLSYERFGMPLTGDRMYSMQHGPVLGEMLSLIERPETTACEGLEWNQVVTSSKRKGDEHYYIELAADCRYSSEDDLLELSNAEVDLLAEVWRRHGRQSAVELEKMLHDPKECPEWNWHSGDSRNPIEIEALLSALNFSEKEAADTIESLREREAIDRVFPR